MNQPSSLDLAIKYVRMILGLCCVLAVLTSCAWTLSNARSKRISDCLNLCHQQAASSSAPDSNQVDWGIKDTRSPCEQKCHAKQ